MESPRGNSRSGSYGDKINGTEKFTVERLIIVDSIGGDCIDHDIKYALLLSSY